MKYVIFGDVVNYMNTYIISDVPVTPVLKKASKLNCKRFIRKRLQRDQLPCRYCKCPRGMHYTEFEDNVKHNYCRKCFIEDERGVLCMINDHSCCLHMTAKWRATKNLNMRNYF